MDDTSMGFSTEVVSVEEKAAVLGLDEALFWEARQLIRRQGTSCIVVRDGDILHRADGRGVAPLVALYQGDKMKLTGSTVIDRVIGKAAAMILVLGGVKSVYGDVLSASAAAYLTEYGIAYQYGEYVERIVDRTGTGMCPIEASVFEIDDPQAGLTAMMHKMEILRQEAGDCGGE